MGIVNERPRWLPRIRIERGARTVNRAFGLAGPDDSGGGLLDALATGVGFIIPGYSSAYEAVKTVQAFTEPTPEAQAEKDQIDKRWAALVAWNAPVRVPDINPHFAAWIAWSKAWTAGQPDPTALMAQSADLEAAENRASEAGYPGTYHPPDPAHPENPFAAPPAGTPPSRYGSEHKIPSVPVEQQTPALQAADATVKTAGSLVQTAFGAITPPGMLLPPIPLPYKILGVTFLLLAAGVGFKILTMPVPAVRIGGA